MPYILSSYYYCWCICEPMYRGTCIGIIYPTLLGFGRIDTIILLHYTLKWRRKNEATNLQGPAWESENEASNIINHHKNESIPKLAISTVSENNLHQQLSNLLRSIYDCRPQLLKNWKAALSRSSWGGLTFWNSLASIELAISSSDRGMLFGPPNNKYI